MAVAGFDPQTGSGTLVVFLGNGDGSFQPPATYPAGIYANLVAIGDFNRDGKLDVVVAGVGVSLLLGKGDGTFQSFTVIYDNVSPDSLAIGDFNGDGKADIAVSSYSTMSALLGNGDGTFQTPLTYGLNTQAKTLAALDLNGDGRTDLAFVNSSSTNYANTVQVALFLATGPASTTSLASSLNPAKLGQPVTLAATVSPATATGAVTFYDGVTAIGRSNLISGAATLSASNLTAGAHSLTAYFGGSAANGAATSSSLTQTIIPPATTTTLSSSLNPAIYGQSITLTAAVSPSSATGTVTFTDGSITLGTATLTAGTASISLATFSAMTHLITASYSGDPWNAASNSAALSQSVYGRSTTVSLSSSANPSAPGQTVVLTAAITPGPLAGTIAFRDGATTLASYPIMSLSSNAPATLTITYSTSALSAGTHSLTAVYVGDTNDQSSISPILAQTVARPAAYLSLTSTASTSLYGQSLQLVATMSPANASGRVTFYDGVIVLGQSPLIAGAAKVSTIAMAPGTHDLKAWYSGDSNNQSLWSPQFTQNVAASYRDSYVTAAGSPISTGTSTRFVITADFNGDGRADLAVASSNQITILLGSGSGTFTVAPGSPFAASSPVAMAAADFNGDGKQDLAIVGSNGITVLLGTGSGAFAAAPGGSFNAGSAPAAIVIGDFNHDGRADLAVANKQSNSVSLFLGNGDGSFTAATSSPFAVGSLPAALVAGDFNGDGNADLAVANSGSNNVTILLGDGAGHFNASKTGPVAVGTLPQAIAAGDFDHNGSLDLAVANYGSSNVTILLGDGAGSFTQPQTGSPLTTGANPSSLIALDLNSDGNLDLAVACNLGNNSPNLYLFTSDATGKFTGGAFSSPLTAGSGASALAVADFNGDNSVGFAIANSSAITVLLGSKYQLKFTTQPVDSVAGQQIPVVVQLQDQLGNPAPGYSYPGTLISSPAGVALMPGMSAGISTSVINLKTAGTYTLTAAFGQNVVSNSFQISAAPASQLVFTTQPVNGVAGTTMSKVTVQIEDAYGNLIAGSNTLVTLISSPASISSTVAAVNGIATFSNLRFPVPGVYSLTASTGGLSSATSNSFITESALTTMSLSSSPNPSVFGKPVTLTATVTGAASGVVTFYDGVIVLGEAQVSSGKAVLVTSALSAGRRALHAYYSGAAAYGATTTVTQVVNAAGSSAFVQAKGSPINMSIRPASMIVSDFNGDGIADVAVCGYIYAAGGSSMTVYLGKGDGTFTALTSFQLPVGNCYAVAGDFNGDGKTDLAVAGYGFVAMLSGIGDGTFSLQSMSNSPAIQNAVSIAAADLNGDGKLDLVVGQFTGGPFVMFGDGAGSFTSAAYGPLGPSIYSGYPGTLQSTAVIGDFNGDGKPDIASNWTDGTNSGIMFWLGDGNGGFSPGVFLPGAYGALVVGDFNGDGKDDLSIGGSFTGGELAVLYGSSNGLSSANAFVANLGQIPLSVAAGDFNGDGKLDLVITLYNSDSRILLGDGAGGFTQAPFSPGLSSFSPSTLAVADLNGDGRADLVTAGSSFATGAAIYNVDIFLGAAAAPQLKITTPPANSTAGVMLAPVVVQEQDATGNIVTGYNGPVTVNFNPAGNSATVDAVNGIATFNTLNLTRSGSYTLTATANGVNSSPSAFSVAPGPAAKLAFLSQPVSGLPSQIQPAISVQVQDYFGNLAAGSTASITLASSPSGLAATAVAINGVVTYGNLSAGSPGTYALVASSTGLANVISQTFVLAKLDQAISFATIADRTADSGPITLSATATSELAVTFDSASPANCTVSASTVTMLALGSCSIVASQSGSADYNAAPAVTQSFNIQPYSRPNTISFPGPGDQTYGAAPITVTASASSQLPVAIAASPAAVCTASGHAITMLAAGACTLTATQSGGASGLAIYPAATPVARTFNINKAGQTVTFASIPSHLATDAPFTLTATASSGLPVTFTVAGPATITNSTLTITGAGTISVQGSQAGNGNFNAAAPVTQTFAATAAATQITWQAPAAITYGTTLSTAQLNATSTIVGAWTYAPPLGAVLHAGPQKLSVTLQPSDPRYSAATASVTLQVNPAPQSISFPAITQHTSSDDPFTLQATSSAGLPVAFRLVSGPASLVGGTVTIIGVGSVSIEASQPGTSDFTSASTVTRTFGVVLGIPVISAVMNAASYQNGTIAADSYAVLFGKSFAPDAASGGASVTIRDSGGAQVNASAYYTDFGQIDFIVPSGLATGPAAVTVTNAQGTSAPFSLTIAAEAPALFTADASGKGAAAGMADLAAHNGDLNQPLASCSGTPRICTTVPVPFESGSPTYLVLFGTGIRGRTSLANVQVSIGNVPADVQYAGAQGQYGALDQVNVMVPTSLQGSGELDLVLTVDGLKANPVRLRF